ncbi:hypothetical protein [Streptomyces sp. NRRL S-495]|uniref:hypothetical protein n=1 Tax=Streptomyces sp. NRRL S-495 TaxID=1609133 RepID=UPI0005F8B7C1|nr:hypothetical protein [Streptomyces sp. NRRL S-495]KJY26313.1 hypothetical protein VR45_37370 [Streptomyces sp. NRRL S-495]
MTDGHMSLHYAGVDTAINDLEAHAKTMHDQMEDLRGYLNSKINVELVGDFSVAAGTLATTLHDADVAMGGKIVNAHNALTEIRGAIRDADMRASTHFDHVQG